MSKRTPVNLVVTDMDGTFLGSDKKIPDVNLQAAHELRKRGIPLVICTGRPVFMVYDYARKLELKTPVIGCNGALIQEPLTGKVLSGTFFSAATIKKIIDFCLAEKLDFLTYDARTVYFQQFSKRIALFDIYNDIAKDGGSPQIPLKNVTEFYESLTSREIPVSKMLIAEYNGGDLEKAREFLADLDGVYAVPSMDTVIDIMPSGVSKGDAVVKMSELFNVPLERMCVLGDHKNDVSMLRIAGVSVCMANGEAEAKKSAKFTTKKTNDQGGFAEAVARFILQEDCINEI